MHHDRVLVSIVVLGRSAGVVVAPVFVARTRQAR